MDIEISDQTALRIWFVVGSLIAVSTGLLSYIYPNRFFNQFIWKYFWGPIVADGHGSSKAERIGGETFIPTSGIEDAIIAEPGYTITSTLTYAALLVFGLIGVILVFRRIDYEINRETVIAFVPLMIFGGLIRVAEDLNAFVYTRTDAFIVPFPYSSVVISPLIYVTIFIIGFATLTGSYKLQSREVIENENIVIGAVGTLFTLLTLLGLGYSALSYAEISGHAIFPIVTIGLSLILSIAMYVVFNRYTSLMNGVGRAGFLLILAHSLDGFANVITLDWLTELGISSQYRTKHVVNKAVRSTTRSVQPEGLTELIGVTWPFIILKMGIVVFLLWVLNEEFFDDSKKTAVLTLLIAIAVGLGPAIRDITRVTLGI